MPLADAQDRLRELLEAKWDAGIGTGDRRRRVRRIDLLGVDEVPDGHDEDGLVDGTDQVLVVNSSGELYAVQGICSTSTSSSTRAS